jgi:L-cysteine S-thiosulfotransferase
LSARTDRIAAGITAACGAVFSLCAAAQALVPFQVDGREIRASLTGAPGDVARGLEVVRGRAEVNCLLCHSVPGTSDRFMGNLGPPLAGAGARFRPAQLRLWLVDARRVVPDTIMPSYYRVDGLNMVATRYRGKPILDAQQIEDAVSYLATLKEGAR